MNKLSRFRCIIVFFGALAACSSNSSSTSNGSGDSSAHVAAALVGTWKSNTCEQPGGMISRRRTYVFTAATGSTPNDDAVITYDIFGGTACEAGPKLFTVTTRGNAAFAEPSSKVSGATDVVFTFASRAATPSAAGVPALKAACGQYSWTADMGVDISQNGCGMLVQSDTDCPVEYDLAAIVDGAAYFGDRSQPLCSEATRPTMLAQWGVVKQP